MMTEKQQMKTATPKPWQLESVLLRRPDPIAKKVRFKATKIVKITPATTKGAYDGVELHRKAGIPAERFRAFELPSMTHFGLVYPRVNK